jgi:hypothetical protein
MESQKQIHTNRQNIHATCAMFNVTKAAEEKNPLSRAPRGHNWFWRNNYALGTHGDIRCM